MATKIKIGKMTSAAADGIHPHIRAMYDRPGATMLAVVELEHVERTQPGPASEADASVTCRISHLEVPVGAQVAPVRELQRALYLTRTAKGTLDGDGEVELAEVTVRQTAGMVLATDAAQCRAALRAVRDMAERARRNDKATAGTMAADLEAIEQAITGYLHGHRDAEADAAAGEQLTTDGE